ncbi:fatty acid elongase [Blastocystis sp. subtype 4]|uniref:fatty acid elongase n=1 Tax=Blastocystis sp. subtype 4 TaxID=944170 RepID=UPI000712089B|nr:fatty acid elongase [Blastocystis sp. subtype 4]KNB43456.1 fatty acid elongase [Blastocystis sp. subtype 4]|eukprot:XP_014526899.1 fatty acid elongase [Blastocystis sp. subtype 4]
MNSHYRETDISESTVQSQDQIDSPRSVNLSFSHIFSFLKYITVGSLWLGMIFLVLNYTGVVGYLQSFDSSFRYQRGVTPLTSSSAVASIILGYVFSLPLLQWLMRDRKPIAFPSVITVHNLFLMMASAILACGISIFVFKDMYLHGFHHSVCSAEVHDNPYLHLIYYLNYLLKYYEFIDTYIIILKKRKVIFLHWYHHASVTALLTYIQQNDYTPVQWVPILMNLIVPFLVLHHS